MSAYRFYLYHPDLKQAKRITDPIGWDSSMKTIERDPNWHGVFFKYTPKLQFIKDGKAIIQGLYEQYGIEAEVELFIYKRGANRKFEIDYRGRLNLTPGSLQIQKLYLICNIDQTGFTQKLKNRQDIKVNLQSLVTQDGSAITPFTNETVDVLMHSKVIRRDFAGTLNDSIPVPFGDNARLYLLNSFESVSSDEVNERISYHAQYSSTSPVTLQKYQWKVETAGDYTMVFDVNVDKLGTPTDVRGKWFIVHGVEGNYTTIEVDTYDFPASTGVLDYDYTGTFNFALEAGDEVYIYFDMLYLDESSIEFGSTFDFTGTVTFSGETTIPATTVPYVLLHEAFDRVVHSITDQADSFRSTIYGRTDSEPTRYDDDGAYSLKAISRALAVRGFPIGDYPIYASLKDLLKTVQSIDGVGIGIEKQATQERVVVEDLTYFYKPEAGWKISNVTALEKVPLEDYFFNELEIGYEKWNNEQVNNLDEFNTKREYTLPLSQVRKKLNLLCPYIASGYTFEFLRRDSFSTSGTKDNDRDNDNVILQLLRDGADFVPQKDEGFAAINNLISPETSYNLELSPMRNLIRNGRLLRGGLLKQSDKSISLSFGEGNTELTTQKTGDSLLNEKTIAISNLPNALWTGEAYRYKAKVDNVLFAEIEANLYKYGEFSETTTNYKKGYLLKLEPDKDGYSQFTLLRANV